MTTAEPHPKTEAVTPPGNRKANPTVEVEIEWQAAPVPEHYRELVTESPSTTIGEELAAMLARRGVQTLEEAERFLHPSLDQLHDPKLLPGMVEAVSRLAKAKVDNESVAIVGDYDADGISGTALLVACFKIAGLEVTPILPHRLKDGYGFQVAQVEQAEELGCSLIVTVDCGMTSAAAVGEARARGMDVVITDHHLPSDELPEAVALVNPRLELPARAPYPNPDLCGAGIAFKLGAAVLEAQGIEAPVESLLRVACLGTIADLVPLKGENRCIAALGLEALSSSRSPGLRALMSIAKVKTPVSAEDVGYRLGPRLNAAGRLDAPDRALDLLLTRDEAKARTYAAQLDRWNQERQSADRKVVREAREYFLEQEQLPRILVAANESWHRGVVGIAAGRLAREFQRPTILMEISGDEATGSGRSIEGIHLHQFLSPWKERLVRFGGHSQALGMTIRARDLETLREEWNEASAEWADELLIKRYTYELEVSDVGRIRSDLYEVLESLQPFGQENRAPLLRVGPLRQARPPRLFADKHLDLQVEDVDGNRMRLTGWNWASRAELFEQRFEVLARVGWDSYLGEPSLTLVDAKSV